MKRESFFVGLAILLGAGIGGWAAIELSTLYTWSYWLSPFGATFGGIIGYLAYDPKDLWRGITRAWDETTNWRPNRLRWIMALEATAYPANISLSIALFVCAPITISFSLLTDKTLLAVFIAIELIGAGVAVLICCLWFAIAFLLNDKNEKESEYGYRRRLLKHISTWREDALACSPRVVFDRIILKRILRVAVAIPGVLAAAPGRMFSLLRVSRDFCWRAFRYVHSEERKLCLVYATLFAFVGLYFGNPLVGAIVGSVLGVVNYEIISVRWLKLVPK